MTTKAKILSALPDGHGLLDQIVNEHYHLLTTNQKTQPIVALVIIDPVEHGGRKTAKNVHLQVGYALTHFEPVYDLNEANELRWRIQGLYEQRTSGGTQRALPGLDASEKEKRLSLMERIEDWSKEHNLSGGALDAMWRENFGIQPGAEWSFGDKGVPGDYRKASFAYLLQFAYDVGVLSTETPLPHEGREDVEVEDDEAGDDASGSGASDEGEEVDTVGVKCQVCNKKSNALTDGLCPKCAKNAGIPVAADHVPEPATA